MIELKPCPFCGSKNIKIYDTPGTLSTFRYAECNVCGCRIGNYPGRELAEKAWNKRFNSKDDDNDWIGADTDDLIDCDYS